MKMKVEINPRSLLNLENICEVLYKLHPSVLNYLVDMERSLGKILGFIDLDNPSLEERAFLANISEEVDYSLPMEEEEDNSLPMEEEDLKSLTYDPSKYSSLIYEELLKSKDLSSLTDEDKLELAFSKREDEYKSNNFHRLLRYIKLDTDEYIPIKIYIEVEDPVIGKKVKELVRALENTKAPEQFYYNKREIDRDAYFAEGYNLTMNENQKKKYDELFWGEDVEGLKNLLIKDKLYP